MSSLSLLCLLYFTIAIARSIDAAAIAGREKRGSETQVFKIPLKHESTSRNTWSKLNRRDKREALLSNSDSQPSQHHGLSSDNDFYYYGLATIGTPPQEFRMYLDTGSADIWVPSSKCDTAFCKAPGRRRFMESASSTLHKTAYQFDISYCDNTSAVGTTAYDTLSMAGLTVYPQAFGIMENVDDPGNANLDKYDGIFGLSYPHYANPGTVPFFLNLVLKNAIPSPVFSFWLNRDPKTSQQQGGELTFGGVDPDHYVEPIRYFPVSKLGDWGLEVTSALARVPDGTVLDLGAECVGDCTAIIDTGTAYVVGPGIAQLLDALEVAQVIQPNGNYTYVVECSKLDDLPTLAFRFSGQNEKLTLEPIHYTFPVDSINGSCFRAVALDNQTCSDSKYILGDSFLGKYYSVYDMGQNRIGLALAKNGPEKGSLKGSTTKKPDSKTNAPEAQALAAAATSAGGKSVNSQSNLLIATVLMALVTGLFHVHA